MTEYHANTAEQKKAEKIRRQYVCREASKITQLQMLDAKVKKPGRVLSSAMGVVGTLVMGFGMALVLEWEQMLLGLGFGVPGLALVTLAYPVYALITNCRKKKYAEEIIRLSDGLVCH